MDEVVRAAVEELAELAVARGAAYDDVLGLVQSEIVGRTYQRARGNLTVTAQILQTTRRIVTWALTHPRKSRHAHDPALPLPEVSPETVGAPVVCHLCETSVGALGQVPPGLLGKLLFFGPEGVQLELELNLLRDRMMARALYLSGGQVSEAARLLRLKRTTLANRVSARGGHGD